MRESDFFPSDFIKADDLGNREVTLTINSVAREEFNDNGRKDYKPVVSFKKTDKRLVLNRTNFRTIADMHGEDTDEWSGKPITIYRTQVDFRGKQVKAIRVKLDEPQQAEEAWPEDPPVDEPDGLDIDSITDDDIPF